jgi:putative transcriptional regulator
VREFPESLGLGGSLLIAHPNLLDPNFRRTVLFISAHDAQEGSFGFVLNRTTDKNVSEFFPDRELDGLANVPVFIGGPVSPDQLMFVAFQSNGETISCRTHLSIDEARGFVEEDVESVRAFIGYAGWSEGQLEAELAQKAWLVQKPDREILDLEKCKAMWPTIMREQGPWFRLLAAAPDDPSRN